MYQVLAVEGDQWTIVDDRDEVVFIGTKQTCEDWLDSQDNLVFHHRPSRASGWIHRFYEACLSPRIRVGQWLRHHSGAGHRP